MPRASARSSGSARALAPGGRLVLSPLDALPEADGAAAAAERAGAAAAGTGAARRTRSPAPAREADRGRLDAARALCLETLRERPLDADAHLLLAAVEEERGDLDAAIWALRRAIYTAPDGPAAHFRLGGLLLRTRGGRGRPAQPRHGRRAAGRSAPDALVDGLTAGEVLAAVKAAS